MYWNAETVDVKGLACLFAPVLIDAQNNNNTSGDDDDGVVLDDDGRRSMSVMGRPHHQRTPRWANGAKQTGDWRTFVQGGDGQTLFHSIPNGAIC